MSKIEDALKCLKTDEERRELLKESRILADDLSLELIRRVGGPNSPLPITELPIPNFPRDITLAKLCELENLRIFESSLEKNGEGYVRVFKATPLAKKLAQIIM